MTNTFSINEIITNNKVKTIKLIKALINDYNTDIEVCDEDIKLIWIRGLEFIYILFNKHGEVWLSDEKTNLPVIVDIGEFMGEELYKIASKEKK